MNVKFDEKMIERMYVKTVENGGQKQVQIGGKSTTSDPLKGTSVVN